MWITDINFWKYFVAILAPVAIWFALSHLVVAYAGLATYLVVWYVLMMLLIVGFCAYGAYLHAKLNAEFQAKYDEEQK